MFITGLLSCIACSVFASALTYGLFQFSAPVWAIVGIVGMLTPVCLLLLFTWLASMRMMVERFFSTDLMKGAPSDKTQA